MAGSNLASGPESRAAVSNPLNPPGGLGRNVENDRAQSWKLAYPVAAVYDRRNDSAGQVSDLAYNGGP